MEQRSGNIPKLKQDALIERLVPEASQLPDVRVLGGFLGKSTREGYWRLYLTPTLNEYVEFAEDDVVHSHALESDESQLGGTLVWVRREANLQHTRSVSREAQVDFLQGAITASVSRSHGLPKILALQPQYHQFVWHSIHISCIHEFCEFVPKSGGGLESVLCTWSAECP